MAGLRCEQCEDFTDESAFPICEDCQYRAEYRDEDCEEDDGESYYTETDEHRTY